MKVSVDIRGMEDLGRLLRTVAPDEAVKILKKSVRKTSQGIAADAQALAPIDTGTLWANVRSIDIPNESRLGRITSGVTARGKRSGRRRGGDSWYWHLVEFGTKLKAARPFIGPAADRWDSKWITELRSTFVDELRKVLKRRAKKESTK